MFNLKKKTAFKIIALATTMAVVTSFSATVFAKTQSELEAELAALRQKQQSINAQLNNIKDDIKAEEERLNTYIEAAANIYEQIKVYDGQIEALNNEIQQKNAEIDAKNKEIEAKLLEISKKEEEHKQTNEKFKDRLAAMYISSGDNNVINAVFGSDSFADMLTQAQVIKNISDADKKLMDELLAQKKQLEQMKLELENQKAEIENAKAQIETKKADIEKVKSVQVEKKKELEALEQKSNEIIAQKEAQQSALQQNSEENLGDQAIIQELIRKAEEEAAAKPPVDGGGSGGGPQLPNSNGWLWPVGGYNFVSQGYHSGHTGIDIAAAQGTPIYASRAGLVVFAGYGNGSNGFNRYGNVVLLRHDNGYYTLYAHAHYLNVSTGQTVSQGQVIGGVGNTGQSYGNHLHFEVRDGVQGNRLNPFSFVSK